MPYIIGIYRLVSEITRQNKIEFRTNLQVSNNNVAHYVDSQ